jgi:hypothetical protein
VLGKHAGRLASRSNRLARPEQIAPRFPCLAAINELRRIDLAIARS